MALLRRQKTGLGDYIDVAMHHAALAALPNVMGAAMSGQPQPDPKHERTTGGSAFYQIYETSDGRHLVLGAQEIKFVRNLLDRLGRSDLVALCEQGPGAHQAAGDRVPARRFPATSPWSIGARGSRAWTSASRRSTRCARRSTTTTSARAG